MKFHELAIGQKFEFLGTSYIKTTPMIGSAIENASQKFMARSATVRLLEALIPATLPSQAVVQIEIVHTAFEAFYVHCQAALQTAQCELNPESIQALQAVFAKERETFLASL